ncbi:ubiquinol-cytochrome c reductase iron-sulfur subunit [Deinococcus yavapaiensis]|uniref:Rieske iron-sulfur protein n=1 Tax=Deinococcus yavapaiensis KR-236 TaxID=694435 RepID=A0A318S4A3_9DEIO|nr:Rieske 2Fe-2S domain-containing protein [Deinococcus yavapaiensis]PYE53266.1 rieske iron-sulfur protein [Deinococcus yavapaiensis KR-236]
MSKNVSQQRRLILKAAAMTGVAAAFGQRGAAQGASAASVVQNGDVLVYQSGTNAEKPINPKDLKEGEPVLAFAMDPKTKQIRDKTKGNIVVVKLKAADIKASSKSNAADGIVAYSAICTHQGCAVSKIGSLGSAKGNLDCPCHHSLFDPRDNAKVVGGPAPRRLPALPLKLEAKGVQIAATGGFIGRVGTGK